MSTRFTIHLLWGWVCDVPDETSATGFKQTHQLRELAATVVNEPMYFALVLEQMRKFAEEGGAAYNLVGDWENEGAYAVVLALELLKTYATEKITYVPTDEEIHAVAAFILADEINEFNLDDDTLYELCEPLLVSAGYVVKHSQHRPSRTRSARPPPRPPSAAEQPPPS